MRNKGFAETVLAISVFLILACFVPSSYAGPQLYSGDATGSLLVIDGDPSDWAGSTPSIEMNTSNYPIPAYVYFKNDAIFLYVLVDAVGDQTNGAGCDEVLLEFNLSPTTDFEVGLGPGGLVTNPSPLPTGSLFSISFQGSFNDATPHRIYELRIPLSYFGASAGQNVYFSSPFVKAVCGTGSLPYDGGNDSSPLDNIYPFGLNQSDPDTYARLQLNGQPISIPTMTEWGMIIFVALAGLGAVYYLRRQKTAKS